MKRKHLLAATVLGTLVVLMVYVIWSRPADPVYGGRRLSEWLPGVGLTIIQQDFGKGEEDRALIAIGTNAMPYLLAELQTRDSKVWNGMVDSLAKRNLNLLRLRTSQQRQIRALVACKVLKQDARAALPAMISLRKHSPDFYVRLQASEAIVQVGAFDPVAIPVLIELMETPKDDLLRFSAAVALGQLGDPALVATQQLFRAMAKRSAAIRVGESESLDGAEIALVTLGVITNRSADSISPTPALPPLAAD